MRVLAFCDYFTPSSCGGSERVAREIYDRLSTLRGWEITLITAVPRTLGGSNAVSEHLTPSGVRVVTVPATDLAPRIGVQLTVSRRLARVARRLYDQVQPDVLHAHSLHFHGTIVASQIARRTGCPLVTTAHLGGGDELKGSTRMLARTWDRVISQRIIRASTGMVAVSSAVAAHLTAIGADEEQLFVAPNGVDHSMFYPPTEPRPEGPLHVGFIGRMIANKGPDVLAAGAERALELGADLQLTFIGDGPMREQVEARVRAGALAARTAFAGQVEDVARRLRELDVVIRPSTTEGLPLAVLEAMATGRPVVASDIPGNREVITHGRNGFLFPVGDVESLAQTLVRLSCDPAAAVRLGLEARRTAVPYTWERSTDIHSEALSAASRMRVTPSAA